MAAPSISVNGASRPNIFSLLAAIKDTACLRQQLRPRIVRKVHGDLYPDNILVYAPSIGQPCPSWC